MSWRDRAAEIIGEAPTLEPTKPTKPLLSVLSVPTPALSDDAGALDLEEWALGLLKVLEDNPTRRYAAKVDATGDPVRIYLAKRGEWCVELTCPYDSFDPFAFMSLPDYGAMH